MRVTGCQKHPRFCRAAVAMWRAWLAAEMSESGRAVAGHLVRGDGTTAVVEVRGGGHIDIQQIDPPPPGVCLITHNYGIPDMGGE